MIVIGLGGNIPYGSMPISATLHAALDLFLQHQIRIDKRSSFYHTRPVPHSDQPWFINAVVSCTTHLAPGEVLQALLHIEETFGRVRSVKNAARTLDLDIIDYNGKIFSNHELELPHPRLSSRSFVLMPLQEIIPDWRHPQTGQSVATLIAALAHEDRVNIKIF